MHDFSPRPRILILRLSALGDIVHTLPLLAALRRRWPEAHIGWLVEPLGRALLQDHPLIDRLHVIPRNEWKHNRWAALRGPLPRLREELRAEQYEISIDAQGLTKSALWGLLAGARLRVGFRGPSSRELAGWLNTTRIAPPPGALHVVEKNLSLLAALGIEPGPVEFPLDPAEPARRRVTRMLGEDRSPFVIINPGAGWKTKLWPAGRFGELAARLAGRDHCRVGIAWGPGEESLAAAVLEAAGRPAPLPSPTDDLPTGPGIFPLPRTTIAELVALISRADLFVGGDTGPTHLAAALGVPTVSMMGPLDARRNGPYGPHCHTIQHALPRPAPPWRNHRQWCDPATDLRHVTLDEVDTACGAKLRRGRDAA